MSHRVKLGVWEQSWELGNRVCKGLEGGMEPCTFNNSNKVIRLEKLQVPDESGEGRAFLGEHWEIRVLMIGLEGI